MIANFFQSLSEHGVEYLLISGQAAILYGAATFSEDIDLWINPTSADPHCPGLVNRPLDPLSFAHATQTSSASAGSLPGVHQSALRFARSTRACR